jgi:hypothetical protein
MRETALLDKSNAFPTLEPDLLAATATF